jgi:hypothetical protein
VRAVSVFDDDPPKRFGRRENVRSPSTTVSSQRLGGVSTRRKSREELGTREVRVHASRSGGRSRSDGSRVFDAGRSQGLVESEGASRKEARKPH